MFRGGKVPEDIVIQCDKCGMWIFKSDVIIDEHDQKLCFMCSICEEDENENEDFIEEFEEWENLL